MTKQPNMSLLPVLQLPVKLQPIDSSDTTTNERQDTDASGNGDDVNGVRRR